MLVRGVDSMCLKFLESGLKKVDLEEENEGIGGVEKLSREIDEAEYEEHENEEDEDSEREGWFRHGAAIAKGSDWMEGKEARKSGKIGSGVLGKERGFHVVF
ncbi:hypothetical protein SLE2022_288100 [Rubroshorea leprosula]